MKSHIILNILQIPLVAALPRRNEQLHPALLRFRPGFDGKPIAILLKDSDAVASADSISPIIVPTTQISLAATSPTPLLFAQHTSQATITVESVATSADSSPPSSPPVIPVPNVAPSSIPAPEKPSQPAWTPLPPVPSPSVTTEDTTVVAATSVQVVSQTSTPLPVHDTATPAAPPPIVSTSTPAIVSTQDVPTTAPTSVPAPPPPQPPSPVVVTKHKAAPAETTTTSSSVIPVPAPVSDSTSSVTIQAPSPVVVPTTSTILPVVETTSTSSPAPPETVASPSPAVVTTTSIPAVPSTPVPVPASQPIETSSTSESVPTSTIHTPHTRKDRHRQQHTVPAPAPQAATPVVVPSPETSTTSTSTESPVPVTSPTSSTPVESTTPVETTTPVTTTPLSTTQTTSTSDETLTHKTDGTRTHTTEETQTHKTDGTRAHTTEKTHVDPTRTRQPAPTETKTRVLPPQSRPTRTLPAQETTEAARHRPGRRPSKDHTEGQATHTRHAEPPAPSKTRHQRPAGPTSFTATTEIVVSTITRTTFVSRLDRVHLTMSAVPSTITETITVTVTRWVPCPAEPTSTRHHAQHTSKSTPPAILTPQRTRGKVSSTRRATRKNPTGPATRHPTGDAAAPKPQTSRRASTMPPMVSVAPSVTVTLETTLTTSEIQTVTVSTTVTAETKGTVHTSLAHSGTQRPFRTTVIPTSRSTTIKPITSGTNKITTLKQSPTAPMSGDIFVPVATGAPPPQITQRGDHPVPPLGIVNQTEPLETNKFYANFFLGTRMSGTWTHPYSVAWAKGAGAAGSWGIAISQIVRSQLVYGPPNTLGVNDPASYYINPVGIQSVILSARELGSSTDLTMDTLAAFSANVNLVASTGTRPLVTFPLVQGMGFVTAVYDASTPLIQSGVFFETMTYGGKVTGGGARYNVILNDGTTWVIYIQARSGSTLPTLTLASSSMIVADQPFSGSIQVAKLPSGSGAQALYDQHAGVYPLKAGISASVSKATGQYKLSWVKGGDQSKTLLMFALPHHVQTLSSSTAAGKTSFQMETTTKGLATAIIGDSWTLVENNLPFDMGFAPWSPQLRSQTHLPAAAVQLINEVATSELSENFTAQTDLNSMYFSGKGLAKFAMMIYATSNLANNKSLASAGLVKLKQSFSLFVNNTQIFPLDYDTTWGGVVSSAGYTDPGADFGNTYYNDHHFHYGYFVYTAAVIGALDPTWLTEGTNKQWVDTLVRDYANPVKDGYFPFSRMFDWYHGHSWAHGIIESGDGKDQESSSEDAMASYGLKMWGRTIGDANMEARGNLMLAIQSRSFNNYYYLQSTNTVEPPNFIGNKAAGIIFENKIDHTTYFGTNIEYIEGIHMLPLNPSSTLTRNKTFVQQEWDTYFSNGRANVAGGWRGILYANLAIIDPKSAYAFFADPNFNPEYLDGGASRTWYLTFCAGLGGAS